MTLLFTTPRYKKEAKIIAKELRLNLGNALVGRFLSRDFYVKLQTAVRNKKCYLLGGTIDDELIQTLLLAHTLKKEGAKEIIALIPYLSYARQDKNEKGKSLGVRFEGELFKTVCIKKVYAIDLHSEADQKLFPIPIISINPYKVLSEKIPQNLRGATIVAPDRGAIDNAKKLKKILQNKQPIVYFKKKRLGENVTTRKLIGRVGTRVVVADDILDTGQTIIHAAKELKKKGVRKITIVATHALFSGKNWQKMWKLGVKKIYCTDSAGRRIKDPRVIYTSIAPIFINHLK